MPRIQNAFVYFVIEADTAMYFQQLSLWGASLSNVTNGYAVTPVTFYQMGTWPRKFQAPVNNGLQESNVRAYLWTCSLSINGPSSQGFSCAASNSIPFPNCPLTGAATSSSNADAGTTSSSAAVAGRHRKLKF